MEKQDIIEGSKIIANYLGWVYIPFNDLQGLSKPGWYKRESSKPNIQKATISSFPEKGNIENITIDVNLFKFNSKNGWIKTEDYYYKYICRSHGDLRFYNSMDELIKIIDKIQKDFSIQKKGYSWEYEGEVRYNFQGFEFTLVQNGAYCDVNYDLDPPGEVYKSFDEKLTWIQNTFIVVVETIKLINKYNEQ